MVWEMCCAPDSAITAEASARRLRAERLTLETGWDLSTEAAGAEARKLALGKKVLRVWLSLPCTPWSSIQNLNALVPSAMAKRSEGRKLSRKMLRVCLPVLLTVFEANGGHFYFEWPTLSQGWRVPELLDFQDRVRAVGGQVYRCRVDGCAYGLKSTRTGLPLRKKWTILTSDTAMHDRLGRLCPGCPLHTTIQGAETAKSAFYPRAMAKKVATIWADSL